MQRELPMPGNRPDYIVKTVTQINGKDRWRDIGVAFQSESGTITGYLDVLPINGKIILQRPSEEREDEQQQQQHRQRRY
jgi:hypothetical protein